MPIEQVRIISNRLRELEHDSPDFWTFDGRDKRVGAHAMFHYPAMMVPQMQGAILDLIREACPSLKRVLDPFVGSGTTLVESMARGLDFSGIDINPLAILISRAKSTMLSPEELRDAEERIAARIEADKGTSYFASFDNQRKWFTRSASIGVSRIARSIERETNKDVRRVFWVVLARIVRSTCNSRPSTYKLHIKHDDGSIHPVVDSIAQFKHHARVVMSALETHYDMLAAANALSGGKYKGEVSLRVADILSYSEPDAQLADVVITSPPYGDNRTTIPYGQYSYLPLRWIPLGDIADGVMSSLVAHTQATDTASLGGSMQDAISRGADACGQHGTYKETMSALSQNQSGQKRFASFASDLKKSVGILAAKTSLNGFHVWTVGERRIGGMQVPMAQLLEEMLDAEGIQMVHVASRRILSKRMATRNSLSETMASEQVLIARRRWM